MAFNPSKSVEVPLSVFGSLVTEMSPNDLPEGVSPDNQDVEFAPGKVSSRRGLLKAFTTAFPAGGAHNYIPSIVYAKSYVAPDGTIRNLFLDSNGAFWVENFTTSPGTVTLLFNTTPGSYCKSITAFGREYIAISDGLHGQEVPLQYDGTNVDRVTVDGPGSAPTVSSVALPSVNMLVTGAPATLTVTAIQVGGAIFGGPGGGTLLYYTKANIFVSTLGVGQVAPGQKITVTGTTATFNLDYTVLEQYPGSSPALIVCAGYFPAGTSNYSGGGTVTIASGITMTRGTNIVTVTTATPHQLQVGFQVQIGGVPAASVGGGIATVTINNEDAPGLATVTTTTAHGLIPGLFVSLAGILGTAVGGGVTAIARQGQVVTVTTASAHNLTPGAVVTLAGFTVSSFNTTGAVLNIISPTRFTFAQVDVDATDTTGTVTLNWPVPNSATPNYFQVQSAPSATTFQVQLYYSDGSWTGGTVSYAWDGRFFVSAVVSPTKFQYQQYGPDATTASVGTVTPYGQASPGRHQLQVMFLTRNGYITKPSPPVSFTANGGQYIAVSNIPTGPTPVIARILAFTGAGGAYFFYIPVAAQVNGQAVSTATQINDNSSTSGLFDFSDNTLYAATGISIPGNNLANQAILDGALGFSYVDSRLVTYGQRNKIQNLLNMSFDGGVQQSAPLFPAGWIEYGNGGGTVTSSGRFGYAWSFLIFNNGTQYGNLKQSMYQDAYGAPIATGNTLYKFRAWFKPTVALFSSSFVVEITSASTGFQSGAFVTGSQMSTSGSWLEATFERPTPVNIPPDLTISIYGLSTVTTFTLIVDELSIIYAETPYRDTTLYASYVDNPEAFDGVTGNFGAANDTRKVMDIGLIRDTPYLLSQDPSGRIHEISISATEPAGWPISEVAANCGALSAFCLTRSQADDGSASGGEEWLAWASASGARIFGGDQPWKISQEIQPDWDRINAAGRLSIWAMNDYVERVIYFGLPVVTALAPNIIYPVNYRELETPYQIATSAPFRPSLSGKLVSTDNTRKWTVWHMNMNGAALMYRANSGKLSATFFGGNGQAPGVAASFGNVYTLSPFQLTDDDYGQINPSYTTFFFVNHESEIALGLTAHRKLITTIMAAITGTGKVTFAALINQLGRQWALTGVRTLSPDNNYDVEVAGGSATGQRIAIKVSVQPLTGGTDNSFELTKLVVCMRANPRLPVRGTA